MISHIFFSGFIRKKIRKEEEDDGGGGEGGERKTKIWKVKISFNCFSGLDDAALHEMAIFSEKLLSPTGAVAIWRHVSDQTKT